MNAFINLFKIRIGAAIAVAAAAGLAVEKGMKIDLLAGSVLVFSVLLASAAAGAFNQYVERDLDVKMTRRVDNRMQEDRWVVGRGDVFRDVAIFYVMPVSTQPSAVFVVPRQIVQRVLDAL